MCNNCHMEEQQQKLWNLASISWKPSKVKLSQPAASFKMDPKALQGERASSASCLCVYLKYLHLKSSHFVLFLPEILWAEVVSGQRRVPLAEGLLQRSARSCRPDRRDRGRDGQRGRQLGLPGARPRSPRRGVA